MQTLIIDETSLKELVSSNQDFLAAKSIGRDDGEIQLHQIQVSKDLTQSKPKVGSQLVISTSSQQFNKTVVTSATATISDVISTPSSSLISLIISIDSDLRLVPLSIIPNISYKLWELFRDSSNASAIGGGLKSLKYYEKMVFEPSSKLRYGIVQGFEMTFVGVLFFQILSSTSNIPIWYKGLDFKPKIRPNNQDASVGIYLLPSYRRQKIKTRILPKGLCLLRQTFPNVSRLYASIYDDNAASIEAFKKGGFQFIGISQVPKTWTPQEQDKSVTLVESLPYRQTVVMSKTYM